MRNENMNQCKEKSTGPGNSTKQLNGNLTGHIVLCICYQQNREGYSEGSSKIPENERT